LEGEGQEAKPQPQRKWRKLYVSVLVANCTSATQETVNPQPMAINIHHSINGSFIVCCPTIV